MFQIIADLFHPSIQCCTPLHRARPRYPMFQLESMFGPDADGGIRSWRVLQNAEADRML